MTIDKASCRLLLDIFVTFLKISPVSFGGGYAMIPVIEREATQHKKWLKAEEMPDLFAVSGAVPGAAAVNAAALVGYRTAGASGAAAAVAGISLPSFGIVLLLSFVFLHFQHHPKAVAALQGIRAATGAMIVYAGMKMAKKAIIDWTTAAIAAASALMLLASALHPALIIIGALTAGLLAGKIKREPFLASAATLIQEKTYVYEDYFIGDGI